MLHQRPGLDEHRGAGQHALLDHLVSLKEDRLRDRQPERLGGLQVNHQLELRRPLHRQVDVLRSYIPYYNSVRTVTFGDWLCFTGQL